jgi:hypothetical protein
MELAISGSVGRRSRMEHRQLVVVQGRAVELHFEVVAHVTHQVAGVGDGDALVAQAVERPAPRGDRQPRARPLRHAAAIPLHRRGDERVLDDVLGEREVAVQAARDDREHRGALVAVGPLERARRVAHAVSSPIIGRISIDP